MPVHRILFGTAAAIVLVGQSVAIVQMGAAMPPAETNRTVFTPADFAQFNTQNVLVMVRRVPGSVIQSDNGGNRGFGQARGNVLIDGQRVPAKSNGVEAALGRIAVTWVVRIEVLDGAQTYIAGLSGKGVNVMTEGKGVLDSVWRYKWRTCQNLPPSFAELNVTLSGAEGVLSRTLEAGSVPGLGGNAGWRDIWDGTGVLIERRDEDFMSIEDDISVSGSLAWKPASGTVANLNATAQLFEGDEKQVSRSFPAGGHQGRRVRSDFHDRTERQVLRLPEGRPAKRAALTTEMRKRQSATPCDAKSLDFGVGKGPLENVGDASRDGRVATVLEPCGGGAGRSSVGCASIS